MMFVWVGVLFGLCVFYWICFFIFFGCLCDFGLCDVGVCCYSVRLICCFCWLFDCDLCGFCVVFWVWWEDFLRMWVFFCFFLWVCSDFLLCVFWCVCCLMFWLMFCCWMFITMLDRFFVFFCIFKVWSWCLCWKCDVLCFFFVVFWVCVILFWWFVFESEFVVVGFCMFGLCVKFVIGWFDVVFVNLRFWL